MLHEIVSIPHRHCTESLFSADMLKILEIKFHYIREALKQKVEG